MFRKKKILPRVNPTNFTIIEKKIIINGIEKMFPVKVYEPVIDETKFIENIQEEIKEKLIELNDDVMNHNLDD